MDHANPANSIPVSPRAGIGGRRHRARRARAVRIAAPKRWTIYVWNERNVAPATIYGHANCSSGFRVKVSRDPSLRTDAARRTVRYHFA